VKSFLTNIVIRLFARDGSVIRRFDANPAVLVPVFVLGELYYGAQKSLRVAENCDKITGFAERVAILGGSIGTAFEFGKIKNELRQKGRMVPENDLSIAALARQHNLTLVSGDQHFQEVDNLRWEQW